MTADRQRWARIVRAASGPSLTDGEREAALFDALGAGASITDDSVGCSVTEMRDDGFRTPAASNELALTLDLAQYEADDGPCVAACRRGQPFSIDVMAGQTDYRGFTAAALAHDVHSSLSLPLVGTRRPSALNLYAAATSAFDDPHSRRVGELLARCVAAVLPGTGPRPVLPGNETAESATARASHLVVVQARQALQARDGIDAATAFHRLTELSRDRQCSIHAVARDVLGATGDSVGP